MSRLRQAHHRMPMVRRRISRQRGNDEHFGSTGQGTPRADRRGHDGLQGGAGRDQRRHGSGGRLAAQEGHLQGRQEGRPHRGRRPDRRRCRRCARPSSSRSIPRPTSSPATMPSRRSCATSPRWRSHIGGDTRGRRRCELSRLRQVGRRHHQGRGRHDRREPELPPLGQAVGVEQGAVATYVHNAVADNLGKLGVLVAIETTGDARSRQRLRAPGRHARRRHQPAGADRRRARPGGGRAREGDLLPTRRASPASPRSIIEKMVEGRLRKFYEEVVLLKQAFVHQSRRHRREGAEGCREGHRRAGQDHRLSCASRSAKASRRKRPTSRPKSRPRSKSNAASTASAECVEGRRVTSRRPSCIAGRVAAEQRSGSGGDPTRQPHRSTRIHDGHAQHTGESC